MRAADIIIIGAGPAGLTAALYSARFLRSTLVLHDGSPRAALIPRSHNVPGFEKGIGGPALLHKMTHHAASYGAAFAEAHIKDAKQDSDGFTLTSGNGEQWRSRALILATGIKDNSIALPADLQRRAIKAGVLRWCPICDGFEHRGQKIAVVGFDMSGAAEALFLRHYSDDVTLIPRRNAELDKGEQAALRAAGVGIEVAPASEFALDARGMQVTLEGRPGTLHFDVVYPALGCRPRSQLAAQLGLSLTECNKVAADAPGGTSVNGLYCAGDLVDGLDQISVAMGHGALAATRAHNWLRAIEGSSAESVLGHD